MGRLNTVLLKNYLANIFSSSPLAEILCFLEKMVTDVKRKIPFVKYLEEIVI